MQVIENKTIKKVVDKYKILWSLGYASALMSWDNETYMPKGAATERGIATSEIAVLRQKLFLRKSFSNLIEKGRKLSENNELNIYENGVIRILSRDLRFYQKVPKKIISDFEKVKVEAEVAWEQARNKDDFKKFKPYLQRIVELNRKIAEHYGYEKHPYDALLDLYEEGATSADFDNIIAQVRTPLGIILEGVMNKKVFPQNHDLETEHYDKEEMRRLNLRLLKILNFSPDTGRLDESAHPFTIGLSMNDVRITTRYKGENFKEPLLSLIHEFGHAVYEQQINPMFVTLPIGSTQSLAVHESQSRFWENHIAKSREFSESFYQLMKEHLPFLEKYSADDIYYYMNIVKPSLIRTEADEITYHFHILLRYEIEKLLIEGSLDISEAPDEWNNKMEEYLDIRPVKPSEGILQDIHWSHGSIGYFPTYTLGSIAAAQIFNRMQKDFGNVNNLIKSGEFTKIREWLREHLHQYGSIYSPREMIKICTGEYLNPEYFMRYLKKKYLNQ